MQTKDLHLQARICGKMKLNSYTLNYIVSEK